MTKEEARYSKSVSMMEKDAMPMTEAPATSALLEVEKPKAANLQKTAIEN